MLSRCSLSTGSVSMSNFLSPLWVSLQVAFIAGILACITAIICAYFMTKHQFRGKLWIELIFLLPIVLPPSVIGFLILFAVGKNSSLYPLIEMIFGHTIIFTKYAAILASSIVAFPIMYQAAKIAFNNIDHHIVEAARIDKANEFEIFKHIIYPISKFALASGAVLAFARAFGEFGATLMVAGNIPGKTQTLPIAIYMAMSVNDMRLAGIYVIIMIIISITFLYLTKQLSNRS